MATPKGITIALACLLAGCANMSPTEKKVAWIVGGVLVTSVAISASRDSYTDPCPSNHWLWTSDAEDWVCVK